MNERYFDNAATTPVDSRVLAEMLPYFGDDFGNANSIHTPGLRAREAVELARERIARLLGAVDPSQIIFTSGATESNNWILNAFQDAIVSPFEHSSIHEPARRSALRSLSNTGWELMPADETSLLSVMAVNNEVGTVWDAIALRGAARTVHSDLTQAAGKLLTSVRGLEYASLSAHKFHGPKGIGALYSVDMPPEALILGGEQENGFRGGTLNVPGIIGMGAAAAIACDELEASLAHVNALRATVLESLKGLADFRVNGGPKVSPYILSISFLGVQGESLVIDADRSGFAISSGAACSSRQLEPSHVLMAAGVEPEWVKGTIRVSFGRTNSEEAAMSLANVLRISVEKLRTMQ